MAITKMDTNKVKDLSTHMISLVNDYEMEITKLFKMLNDVPYVTKEWVGNQAELYFNIVSMDKKSYIDFGEDLKKIAINLSEDSDIIADKIKEIQSSESGGN